VVYRRLYPNRLSLRIQDKGAVIALSVKGPEAATYAAVTKFGAKVEVSEVNVKDAQGSDTYVNPYVLISGPTTLIRENPDLCSAYDLWAGGFTPVDHLKFLPEDGEGLDLLVVLKNVGDIVGHTTALGRVTTRRELEVVDQSGSTVCATLWGQCDPHVNLKQGLVVAVKDAKKVSLPRIDHLTPSQPRLQYPNSLNQINSQPTRQRPSHDPKPQLILANPLPRRRIGVGSPSPCTPTSSWSRHHCRKRLSSPTGGHSTHTMRSIASRRRRPWLCPL